MPQAIVEFVLSAAVVVAAGTFLARAADRLADLTGLGRLLVGSVLLAGATSLPELSVDVSAALRGLDDMAVGDLMGSSLINLLILAIADLVHTERGRMFSRASAAHALSGATTIVLTALVSLSILGRPGVGFLGIGLGSAVVFATYVLGVRLVYQDQAAARAPAPGGAVPAKAPSRVRRRELLRECVQFGVAAAAILAAAPFVARSAGRIADLSGLGGTFIGTTLVAASTSLPELVATIATLRMGAFDLAVGNIFGSNAFNMAMMLPVDAASGGPLLSTVSSTHAVTGLWTIAVTAVAIAGQLYHAEKRRRLIEPDALLIIGLVITALAMVYRLR